MTTKRKKRRPQQLQLPGAVDESLPQVRCVGPCLKVALAVSAAMTCHHCGDVKLLEALTQCVTDDLQGPDCSLDRLVAMLAELHATMREGGTETETANGGGETVDDPRTNEDMQRMYEE